MGREGLDELVNEMDWATAGIDADRYESAARRAERRSAVALAVVADALSAIARKNERACSTSTTC